MQATGSNALCCLNQGLLESTGCLRAARRAETLPSSMSLVSPTRSFSRGTTPLSYWPLRARPPLHIGTVGLPHLSSGRRTFSHMDLFTSRPHHIKCQKVQKRDHTLRVDIWTSIIDLNLKPRVDGLVALVVMHWKYRSGLWLHQHTCPGISSIFPYAPR